MSSSGTMSILGLYNYDTTIFEGFNVPEGMDRDVAVKQILLQTAELEILYPEPETMKVAIMLWSAVNLPLWQRMFNVLTMEYNPIWNVDATETESGSDSNTRTTNMLTTARDTGTITDNRDIETKNTGTQRNAGSTTHTGTQRDAGTVSNTGTQREAGTVTNSGTVKNTGTSTNDITISDTNTHSEAGYNSATLSDVSKDTEGATNQDKRTDNLTRTDDLSEAKDVTRTDNLEEARDITRTDNLTDSEDFTRTDDLTEKTDDDNTRTLNTTTTTSQGGTVGDSGQRSRTLIRQGNIGVTTTQQMIQQELEVATVSIYRTIVESFKKEFCLCVY